MFVQIGNLAVKEDEIQVVFFRDDGHVILVLVANPNCVEFAGPEAEAFLAWWENEADVYVCSVSQGYVPDCPNGLTKEEARHDPPACDTCELGQDCSFRLPF